MVSGGIGDLKAKARRWDDKKVEGMRRKKDRLVTDLKEISQTRRREPELQRLQAEIYGLDKRLNFTKRQRDAVVGAVRV